VENTWENQLKEGKIDFGSQFHRFQSMTLGPSLWAWDKSKYHKRVCGGTRLFTMEAWKQGQGVQWPTPFI
jgi:hypothetical protein